MKATALLYTLMAAAAASASAVPGLGPRDVCGAGYGGDQRRTNSPCQASNGDRHFCGCDRTGVKRSSARVVHGQRFRIAARAPATAPTTAAPFVKLAFAGTVEIGPTWFNGEAVIGEEFLGVELPVEGHGE
ncbi:hypothetical protein ANO14919_132010 [Xylariales sp. No.14919]|nr:hypothetical protein ANO14919_132010 [Xylariales sp. No.14919]